MMYLSARLKPGPHLRTILAHEYMHAVIFSQKTLRDRRDGEPGREEEGWLDEAMAHVSEDMHGFSRSNIDYRFARFWRGPSCYQLVVDDYYAANLFRSHGNRGSTYLFLRWCADHYGPDLLPALLRSERQGTASLEAVTGAPFESLYRAWSVSLYKDACAESGPRFGRIAPAQAVDHWTALGTTSQFVVVDGFGEGAVEVEVAGPAEAKLQVTAMPLGDGRARLDLAASAIKGAGGELRLRAKVREQHGVPVQLATLSWEPLVPCAGSVKPGFHGGRLDALGITAAFGSSAVPASGDLSSRPIPLEGVTSETAPLVIKVIGFDPDGRQVVAWAEVGGDRDSELAEP